MTRSLYSGVTTPAASVTVYWAGTTTKPTIYAGAGALRLTLFYQQIIAPTS